MKKLTGVLCRVVLFFAGWIAIVSFIPVPEFENPAMWRFFAELNPFLAIAGISLLFWYLEKKTVSIFSTGNHLKGCVTGAVGGVIWLLASFLIMSGLGVLKIEGYNSVPMLWLWVLSVFLNTVMQELLVRGYLYQMIKKTYNKIAAALFTSCLFTLLHGGAFEAGLLPVMNVFTMSIFMSMVLEYTDSLMAPVLMHFLWNCVGAVILGGVSLAEDYPHVLSLIFSGSEILSGGMCKMEGSIVVFVLNIIFTGIFMGLSYLSGKDAMA